jgi:SpoVK/Ycf46/Vps4 family AAA+-type ATPase
MPKRFAVNLPNNLQRTKILKLILKDVKLEPAFDFERLVELTNGFSGMSCNTRLIGTVSNHCLGALGSDLKELCRNAAMYPVRETMRSKLTGNTKVSDLSSEVYTLLSDDYISDLLTCLTSIGMFAL